MRMSSAAIACACLRSSSSAIPPSVAEQLEAVFGPPVGPYGTRSGAPDGQRPLPPALRKPGFGRLACGCGDRPPRCGRKSAAARRPAKSRCAAPGVTAGYLGTGCQCRALPAGSRHHGADGYLFVTGASEIINRGGEKSPYAGSGGGAFAHPGVVQAGCLRHPGTRLGGSRRRRRRRRRRGIHRRRDPRRWQRTWRTSKVPARLLDTWRDPQGPTGKPATHRACR